MVQKIAVIRIRGRVGVRKEIKDTLRMLGLKRKHNCVIVPDTPQYLGMIKKVKDYITWGNISEEVLKKLLKSKGEKDFKGVFRLSPPRKGFKGSIKQHYPKGALGNRKEKINKLLERMI